jgi:hypothetical protein
VIHICGPSVPKSRFIPAIHFAVNRVHTQARERGPQQTPSPGARARILRPGLQYIDKRFAPAIFKTESSVRMMWPAIFRVERPRAPKFWICKKLSKGSFDGPLVKRQEPARATPNSASF